MWVAKAGRRSQLRRPFYSLKIASETALEVDFALRRLLTMWPSREPALPLIVVADFDFNLQGRPLRDVLGAVAPYREEVLETKCERVTRTFPRRRVDQSGFGHSWT